MGQLPCPKVYKRGNTMFHDGVLQNSEKLEARPTWLEPKNIISKNDAQSWVILTWDHCKAFLILKNRPGHWDVGLLCK